MSVLRRFVPTMSLQTVLVESTLLLLVRLERQSMMGLNVCSVLVCHNLTVLPFVLTIIMLHRLSYVHHAGLHSVLIAWAAPLQLVLTVVIVLVWWWQQMVQDV